jgi:hypothetical protein
LLIIVESPELVKFFPAFYIKLLCKTAMLADGAVSQAAFTYEIMAVVE